MFSCVICKTFDIGLSLRTEFKKKRNVTFIKISLELLSKDRLKVN